MGLSGNFDTMSLEELLRWVEAGAKTGILEVEHEKIVKRIMFEDGQIVACSSNDPATLMGQFLLSRGRIDQETLREALARQQQCSQNLGDILTEMGAITDEVRSRFVEAKIEETIYGLFDWYEAVFRFDAEAEPDPNAVDVDLEIHEVLERGRQRQVELEQSQEILDDPGIVLRHKPGSDSPNFSGNHMATRVFGLIDGKRTVADILLHSHAPEFLVGKFLTALLKSGVAEIIGVRELPEPLEPIETFHGLPIVPDDSVPIEVVEEEPPVVVEEAAPADVDSHAIDCPAWSFGGESLEAEKPSGPEAQPEPQDGPAVQSDINVALQLMASGQAEAALDLLNAMLEAFPSDSALKHLVDNAENEFRASMLADDLALTRVPLAVQNGEQPLTPEESFLQGLIDGQNDIRAILWVAPMREVDALRALRGMLRKGVIEMRDPAMATAG